jgi:hypothetical protein
MPSHVHTPPRCGFWAGHDPSCFDQAFGVERDCILIEVGKNKGNYLCIHERAPITSLVDVEVMQDGFTAFIPASLAEEYDAIRAQLRPPAAMPAEPPTPVSDSQPG